MAGTTYFNGGGVGSLNFYAGRNGTAQYLQIGGVPWPTGNYNSDNNRVVSIDSISINGESNLYDKSLSSDGTLRAWYGPNTIARFTGYLSNGSHVYNSYDNAYFYNPNWPYQAAGWAGSYNWSTVPSTVRWLSSSRANNGTTLSGSFSGPADNGGRGVEWYRIYTSENGGNWVHRGDGFGNGSFSFSVTATSSYTVYVAAYNSLGLSQWSSTATSGVPSQPTSTSTVISDNTSGKVRLNWQPPTNEQGGVTGYNVYLNGIKNNSSTISSASRYYDFTGLTRGTSYNFSVSALNGQGEGAQTSPINTMAPGVPSQPVPYSAQAPLTLSKTGRNVTVTCQDALYGYGNNITKYYVDYTIDGTTWSTKQEMTNKSFTYLLLPPAKTYQFRCYAYNSIGYGDGTLSIPLFVPAGGKRLRGADEDLAGTYQPTNVAKRYDASLIPPRWVDVNIAKRFVQSENNGLGAWVELT